MGDASMISMEAWIAGHCSQRQCHHPSFLPNKANQRFGNEFNDGIEFGTLGPIGAGHGDGEPNNSTIPRVIRRDSVSGSGFLQNKPNAGFEGEFNVPQNNVDFLGNETNERKCNDCRDLRCRNVKGASAASAIRKHAA